MMIFIRPIYMVAYNLLILGIGVATIAFIILHKYYTKVLSNLITKSGYDVNLGDIDVLGWVIPSYYIYGLAAIAVFLVLLSLFGLYKAVSKKKNFLNVFTSLLVLGVFIVFALLGSFRDQVIEFLNKNTKEINDKVTESMKKLFEENYVANKDSFDSFMKTWKCCGINGIDDFNTTKIEEIKIPFDCDFRRNFTSDPLGGCIDVITKTAYKSEISIIGWIGVVLSAFAVIVQLT